LAEKTHFRRKKWRVLLKILKFMAKIGHSIGFQDKSFNFWRKLAKIAKNTYRR
jgi:hypothetical protein